MLNTNGSPAKIAIAGGTFQAAADNASATAQLDLALGTIGQVQADVQVKDLTGRPRLAGTINANLDNLQPVSAFVPQIQNVSGQVLANLDLSGTLTAPAIGGELRLKDAAVEIPETATRIQDIQLAAVSSGEGILQLSGSARSGPGNVQLSGQLQPATGELTITVTGKEFQVADSPELQALISPDIDLRMAQNRLQIEGQVVIPKAFLSPAGGGASVNRVSASPDVVIVEENDDTPPATTESSLAIFTKIRVILEEVSVEAFDFQGKLKGNLLVEQTPQLAPRGSGSIEVESGEYIIYNQPLTIERGRVLFSGSPLDNPGLDLRVTRTVDNVAPAGTAPAQEESQLGRTAEEFSTTALSGSSITVGAQVTGTLQNPQLTLFSNPAMPDSSILSYLVLGRPPSMEGQTSLNIGKYLTPDLYVGYGLGLFNAVNTFLLRYRLGKRFHLEANSSGEATGADILYTIELR
jgi:translocation and assembly module TamB